MSEGLPKQFSSPEEEISYLREKIALRERELLARGPEVDKSDIETVGKQEIREYASFTPKMILSEDHRIDDVGLAMSVEQINKSLDPVEEIINLAKEKGVRNTLSVLEKVDNAYVVDEVHRQLVEYIKNGVVFQDLKEGVPAWHLLHMTLYEVTLPEIKSAGGREYQLAEIVGMMEQLLAGLKTLGVDSIQNHFVIEIAVADYSDDIVFYIAVPNKFVTLFEKQTLSLFPHAELTIQFHDYNIFVNEGETLISELSLKKHPLYPIRTHEGFTSDPLSVILNAFSKIEREGGGAAMQILIRYPQKDYRKSYQDVVKNMQKGMKASEALSRSTSRW
jgi:hypothetical protein